MGRLIFATSLIVTFWQADLHGQEKVREVATAIEALKKIGAMLIRDERGHVRFIKLPENATDADLKHLAGLPHLFAVYAARTQITDAGVAHFRALPNLRGVRLTETKVTNDGLALLQANRQLDWLDVSGTNVSDAALEVLSDNLNSKYWSSATLT